jgi:hypothetical protein
MTAGELPSALSGPKCLRLFVIFNFLSRHYSCVTPTTAVPHHVSIIARPAHANISMLISLQNLLLTRFIQALSSIVYRLFLSVPNLSTIYSNLQFVLIIHSEQNEDGQPMRGTKLKTIVLPVNIVSLKVHYECD